MSELKLKSIDRIKEILNNVQFYESNRYILRQIENLSGEEVKREIRTIRDTSQSLTEQEVKKVSEAIKWLDALKKEIENQGTK